jgi:hypothetical protein
METKIEKLNQAILIAKEEFEKENKKNSKSVPLAYAHGIMNGLLLAKRILK